MRVGWIAIEQEQNSDSFYDLEANYCVFIVLLL